MKSYVVICDFDGTVTDRDMGGALARSMQSPALEVLHDQFRNEQISLYALQSRVWPQVRLTQQEIDQFMDAHTKLRPGFGEFLDFCRQQNLEFHIVSGGFDFYIPHLLQRFGLTLPQPANLHMNCGAVTASGIQVTFPQRHPDCDYCSNCKGHFIRQLRRALHHRGNDVQVIGIGDGFSDRCMVKEADLIFARGSLLHYCERQGIAHQPFQTFFEIMESLLSWWSGSRKFG